MNTLGKIIVTGGLAIFVLTSWVASRQGWGLPGLRDAQTLRETKRSDCPAYQRDKYGNCPPRTHRTRLGARSFFSGGGK